MSAYFWVLYSVLLLSYCVLFCQYHMIIIIVALQSDLRSCCVNLPTVFYSRHFTFLYKYYNRFVDIYKIIWWHFFLFIFIAHTSSPCLQTSLANIFLLSGLSLPSSGLTQTPNPICSQGGLLLTNNEGPCGTSGETNLCSYKPLRLGDCWSLQHSWLYPRWFSRILKCGTRETTDKWREFCNSGNI